MFAPGALVCLFGLCWKVVYLWSNLQFTRSLYCGRAGMDQQFIEVCLCKNGVCEAKCMNARQARRNEENAAITVVIRVH